MNLRVLFLCVCSVLFFVVIGCSKPAQQVSELKRFPIDSMDGIITQSGVQIDKEVSSDGNGSLKITATAPTVIRLFETGDIDIENARLVYQARLRTEGVEGKVYLQMWCILQAKASRPRKPSR